MPFNWLMMNGWTEGDDVLVCMKHNWAHDPTTGYNRFIFDVCDNHFDTDHLRDHYLNHCEKAALITCNSDVMRQIIEDKTGKLAKVIPDPVEFAPKAAHYSKSFMCFGYRWNVSILRTKPNIAQAVKGRPLEIISEPFADFVTPYSKESLQRGFNNAGAVLIPVGKKKAKSANRLTESINAGCFVIANPMPAYDEFNDYAFIGDLSEGIEWYLNNPEEALDKIRAGQQYIQDKYTIYQIGPMWGDAIGSC
jgi:hypothetical protein